MTKYIFILYIIIGYLVSIWGINSEKLIIPFRYGEIISYQDLMKYSYPVVFGLIIFILARGNESKVNKSKSFNYRENRPLASGSIYVLDVPILFIQLLLLVYYFVRIYINKDLDASTMGIVRYISGKEHYMLLFIQASLYTLASTKIKRIILPCALIISVVFAWFNGSRMTIIPFVAFAFYELHRKNWLKFISFSFVSMMLYLFMSTSRYVPDKFSLDAFLLTITSVFENLENIILFFLSYTFGFSIMHFTYVAINQVGEFYFKDLLYSITPIPSAFLWSVDISRWRVDQFRPLGAFPELYKVSELLFYSMFAFLGRLSRAIDREANSIVKLICTTIFALSTIMLFQYGLRTNQWFFYLIIFILILSNRLNKKNI